MKNTLKKIHQIISEAAKTATPNRENHLSEISLHTSGIAEPGYDLPKSGIVALGNWNDIEDVSEKLTDLDVEIEWNDEWADCCECGKIFRTQANSYGWQASFASTKDGLFCVECLRKDAENYLESIENKSNKAITATLGIDPCEYDYVKLPDVFENGYYGGQNADPKVISNSLRGMGIKRFLFAIESVGQFDMQFCVFVHKTESEKLKNWDTAQKDGADMAEGLKRALESAALQMGKLSGDGIRTASLDAKTGTAKVKMVSAQDFIDGKLTKGE